MDRLITISGGANGGGSAGNAVPGWSLHCRSGGAVLSSESRAQENGAPLLLHWSVATGTFKSKADFFGSGLGRCPQRVGLATIGKKSPLRTIKPQGDHGVALPCAARGSLATVLSVDHRPGWPRVAPKGLQGLGVRCSTVATTASGSGER
jgi:hypothetical protein